MPSTTERTDRSTAPETIGLGGPSTRDDRLPSIRVVSTDQSRTWRGVLSRLEEKATVEYAATMPGDPSDYDINIYDWDAVDESAAAPHALRDAVVIAREFSVPLRDALLRGGASACVLKTNARELAAVLDRDLGRARARRAARKEREELERNLQFLEQRQSSDKLSELESLADAAFDGMLVHDFEKIVDVNRSCAAMFGYTQQEAIGMPMTTFVAPSALAAMLAEARAGTKRQETRGIRKDGTIFDVELSAADFGTRGHRVVAVRDISKRKAIEAALRESELRYRQLSESSHDLLCEHDTEGRILDVNPAAARVLEMSSEELIGKNIRDLLTPKSRESFDTYRQTIEVQGMAEGLMSLVTGSGKLRIWHYRNTLLRSMGATPIVRGLATDVTEREEAVQALRRSERHFRTIIEHASDMIVIVKAPGVVSYHSPATERLLGYQSDEIDGHPFTEFVHENDQPGVIEFFLTKVRSSADAHSLDVRLRHRDGSWRWFSVVASNIVAHGSTPSIVVNGRDITERRRLEAQLEQAKRLTSLGRLTATVAHEFNNVLMGIQPFADLMQRSNVPQEVVIKGGRHISNSIARGKRVALDMLRFTRPPEPATTPIDLREWWERLRPELEASTGNHVQIHSSVPRDLSILADAEQIGQVFSNLVSNARDAMPKGGTITVSARRPRIDEIFTFGVVPEPHRFAHISVQDTGVGMSENVMHQAFDPLFTTKMNGGTGLGLAVVHQIVDKHAGSIFVESTVDVGTTFHVFLPLAAGTLPAEEQEEEEKETHIRAKRVLVIDDEPLIGEGIAETLTERGMDCTIVQKGLDAEAVARATKPDVAIIDIWLADIDGLEVGQRLRALDPNMLIVFASGHGDASSGVRECAPATFLQKPFDVQELLAAIATLEARTRE